MTITPEGLVTLAEALGKEVAPAKNSGGCFWVDCPIEESEILMLRDAFSLAWQPHKDTDQCNECEEWVLSNINYRLEVTRYLKDGGWHVALWEYEDEMRECMSNISWAIGSTLLEAKTSCFIQLAESLKENSNE